MYLPNRLKEHTLALYSPIPPSPPSPRHPPFCWEALEAAHLKEKGEA